MACDGSDGVLPSFSFVVFYIFCVEIHFTLLCGFEDQIYPTFVTMPPNIQRGLFSATLAPGILEAATKFMRDAVCILVVMDELTLGGIRQFCVAIEKEERKLDTLWDLYETLTITQAIILCGTRRKWDFLADQLTKRNFTSSLTQAGLDQKERDLVMRVLLLRLVLGARLHGLAEARLGRAAGVLGRQLRLAAEHGGKLVSHRTQRSIRPEWRRDQPRDELRRPGKEGHRDVLPHADCGNADGHCGPGGEDGFV